MRALVTAFATVLVVSAGSSAKERDFFALTLVPGSGKPSVVCGASHPFSHATTGTRVRATVRIRSAATSERRTPFVVAIRRCSAEGITTVRRIRVQVPAGRPAATVVLPRLRAGEYRIEALLNGDRPPGRAAIKHLVVTARAGSRPQILSVKYGLFTLRGASRPYNALRVRVVDGDGQIVGMEWTQLAPAPDRQGVGIADGGCGLGTPVNGAVGTWYLPMELEPGAYRFRFTLSSSPCDDSRNGETRSQTVEFRVAPA
jgi:hypothetical protein